MSRDLSSQETSSRQVNKQEGITLDKPSFRQILEVSQAGSYLLIRVVQGFLNNGVLQHSTPNAVMVLTLI